LGCPKKSVKWHPKESKRCWVEPPQKTNRVEPPKKKRMLGGALQKRLGGPPSPPKKRNKKNSWVDPQENIGWKNIGRERTLEEKNIGIQPMSCPGGLTCPENWWERRWGGILGDHPGADPKKKRLGDPPPPPKKKKIGWNPTKDVQGPGSKVQGLGILGPRSLEGQMLNVKCGL